MAKIATVAALGASAAVAGGMGVAFAVDSHSKHDQYVSSNCENLPPQSPDSLCGGLAQNGRNETTASTVLYVAGGTLAVAAVATWFLWPNAAATSSWTVRPTFDGHLATAVVVGSF
jgi:hypothetical protein